MAEGVNRTLCASLLRRLLGIANALLGTLAMGALVKGCSLIAAYALLGGRNLGAMRPPIAFGTLLNSMGVCEVQEDIVDKGDGELERPSQRRKEDGWC